MKNKVTKGTNKSLGKVSGASAGLESGLTKAESFKAGTGPARTKQTDRPKPEMI